MTRTLPAGAARRPLPRPRRRRRGRARRLRGRAMSAQVLRAPFPWSGDALELAMSFIADGLLRVDSNGFVWRIAEIRSGRIVSVEPRRAETVGGKGYLRIVLGVPGQRRTCSVVAHRVVYTSLVGAIPDGLQINHRDLNKQNNRPDNLEVVTGSENIAHSYAHGRTLPWTAVRATGGAWRGKPLKTDEEIASMRALRASGVRLRDIAARFGISTAHTHRLTQGAS